MIVSTNDELEHFNNLNRFQQKSYKSKLLKNLIDNAKAEIKPELQDELSYRAFKDMENGIIKKITEKVNETYQIKPIEKLPYLNTEQLLELCSILFDIKDYSEMKKKFLMSDSNNMDEDVFDKVITVHDSSISSLLKPMLSKNLGTLKKYNLLSTENINYLGKDRVKDFFTRLIKLIKLQDLLLTIDDLRNDVKRLQKISNSKIEAETHKSSYKCSCWNRKALYLKQCGLSNKEILKQLNDERISSSALSSFLNRMLSK
jgi:hypothetical protein